MTEQALCSVESFKAFLARSEHRARRFELVDGTIVECPSPRIRGVILARLTTALETFLSAHPLGYAGISVDYCLPEDRLNWRTPDLSFVADINRAIETDQPCAYAPDFIAEIALPPRDLMDAIGFFVRNGTRLIWHIYPIQRRVSTYYRNPSGEMIHAPLHEDDVLSGADILPGFSLPVRDIFPNKG